MGASPLGMSEHLPQHLPFEDMDPTASLTVLIATGHCEKQDHVPRDLPAKMLFRSYHLVPVFVPRGPSNP